MAAAIYFQSDGFVLEKGKIVGRRMAGATFLRAAVEGRQGEILAGYAPLAQSGDNFRAAVRAIDPSAEALWIPANRFDLLAEHRVLFRPDHVIGEHAYWRLRAGPARFSICGITHTLSTHAAMDGICALLSAPVMPWDALICTSTAARSLVETVVEAEADYQRWLGRPPVTLKPQRPIIPLGVHTSDFTASPDSRARARKRLAIEDEEVAVLFAGRLSFMSKAHPYQMLRALQRVATGTGKSIVLILAGQFPNDDAETMYRSAMVDYCPDVRCVIADGADFDLYGASFAGADIFVSLADSIQETFGLTPVEAMAAGLPVVVSDWNGYRDTVREGIDGFRIRCWAPAPGTGRPTSQSYEMEFIRSEAYEYRVSTTISVDFEALIDRLSLLACDPALRRTMGEAGQKRARTDYDWAHIYRRYRDLWAELDAIRSHALTDPKTVDWLARAPRERPARLDPSRAFAAYPTAHIDLATIVACTPIAGNLEYAALSGKSGFNYWKLPAAAVTKLFDAIADRSMSVADISRATGINARDVIEMAARLAKMNLVILHAAE